MVKGHDFVEKETKVIILTIGKDVINKHFYIQNWICSVIQVSNKYRLKNHVQSNNATLKNLP